MLLLLLLFVAFAYGYDDVDDTVFIDALCDSDAALCPGDERNLFCESVDNNLQSMIECANNLIVGVYLTRTVHIVPQLGDLDHVTRLSLAGIGSDGFVVPTLISGLSTLEALSIDANLHSLGSIPPALTVLGALNELSFKSIVFQESGSAVPVYLFGGLEALRKITFDSCVFRAPFPTADFQSAVGARLADLIVVDSRFQVSGPLPAFGASENIETVVYSNVAGSVTLELTDPDLFAAPNLRTFSVVDATPIHGSMPTSLGLSTSLQELYVKNSPNFHMTVGSGLASLSYLRDLQLTGHSVVGTLPNDLSRLTVIGSMLIANTGITGTLPAVGWDTMTELTDLRLRSAGVDCSASAPLSLTGTFPAQLASKFTVPSHVSFFSNIIIDGVCLSGTIPGGTAPLVPFATTQNGQFTFAMVKTRINNPLPRWLDTVLRASSTDCEVHHNAFCYPLAGDESLYRCPIETDGGTVDSCGICGGDDNGCRDCAGTPYGSSQYDVCDVCDGHGDSCLDCARVPNGVRVYDNCGVCGGDNSSCDCSGAPTGSLRYDECGVCGGDNSSCFDCAGTRDGTLQVDVCGVCGGLSSCVDCAGELNGGRTVDACGDCVVTSDPSYRPTCYDCAGVPNGDAVRDVCGNCPADPDHCNPGDVIIADAIADASWYAWIVIGGAFVLAFCLMIFAAARVRRAARKAATV